ncbi:hypothetical protein [Rhodobacter maris]|uniref:Uncharacterized protein n=1 Tax=Rhodobacter maris TaxID=446682 RepID=A0A285RJQ2_9RHOB|nr:hypothetical protein [Rhodobacter maris]SOB94366.1 hypothetical protein SAMN05877831_101414 [Rhodobacter maris]
MSDTGRSDFAHRLERIDTIHAAGGAFEAEGALGRSYFDAHRRRDRRTLPIRALALILIGALLFKGALLAQIGAESYDRRVAELQAGSALDQLGGWAMQADAPTRWIAGELRALLY